MARIVSRNIRSQHRLSTLLMTGGMLLVLVISVFVISQKKTVTEQQKKASGGNNTVCRANSGAEMGIEEAFTIARNSECQGKGTLVSVPLCNSNTGTWWIDLDTWISNVSCSPACVVSVATKGVEINPRCTGAIPSDDDQCKRTGCNAEICQDKSLPGGYSPCVALPEYGCMRKYEVCKVQADGHCAFAPLAGFNTCMSQVKCGWEGSQCKPGVRRGDTRDTMPVVPANQVCLWQNNACRSVNASCQWCGERCKRVLPGESCTKSSTVPPGLSCSPEQGTEFCTITGLPVISSTPTPTPRPTNAPGYCDDSCQTQSDCIGWLGCYDIGGGIKRCRKPQCAGEHTCFCPTGTPTPVPSTPTPTVKKIIIRVTATPTVTPRSVATVTPFPTSTPVPGGSQIRILSKDTVLTSGIPNFVMTGLAKSSSQVEISISPDGIFETVAADQDGFWKLSVPNALHSGEKQVSIVATDTLGKQTTLNTAFIIAGAGETDKKPLLPYVLVFIGAGVIAVITFFILFLRRV